MAVSSGFTQYVIDQLAALGGVTARRMFGGAGLYLDDIFFALISDETLYFKVDDSNREDYVSRGMAPFRPYAARPQVSLTYFAVPAEALEDAEELVQWARRALRVAQISRRKVRTAARRKR